MHIHNPMQRFVALRFFATAPTLWRQHMTKCWISVPELAAAGDNHCGFNFRGVGASAGIGGQATQRSSSKPTAHPKLATCTQLSMS